MNKKKKGMLVILVIYGILLILLIFNLAHYHYTSSDFTEKAIGSILTQREGNPDSHEYQMLQHKSMDGVHVFLIRIGTGDQARTGCATFVKYPVLPLYRLAYSYVQNQKGSFEDNWVADNFKAIYFVEAKRDTVSIRLSEPMLKERILKFFAMFAFYFAVVAISRGVRNGKISL